jgi:hypothetical protein
MLNDGKIPLGQEPWELFVRNWMAYATGELQCTFGNEAVLWFIFITCTFLTKYLFDSVGNFEEIATQIKVTINYNYESQLI